MSRLLPTLLLVFISANCFSQLAFPNRPNNSGRVVVWGRDQDGQANLPTNIYSGVVAVAGGSGLNAALKTNGEIVVWGPNSIIPTEVGGLPFKSSTNAAVLKIFRESMGILSSNGNLAVMSTWGYGNEIGMSNVVDFDLSDNFRIVLKNNSQVEVFASGWNASDILAIPPAAQTNIVKVAAGYFHAGTVDSSGKVTIWGKGFTESIKNVPLAAQSGVVDLSLSWGHAVALKTNGEVVTWGVLPSDQYGSMPAVPTQAQTNVVKVSALEDCSMALLSDGRIVVWGGQNQYGTFSIPTNNQPFLNIGLQSQNTVFAIAPPRWVLSTSVNNSSLGSISPGGYRPDNSIQTVQADASAGYVFDGWTGDAAGNNNPVSVLMNSDKTIIANFIPDLADVDGDGLSNHQEIVTYGTNPNQKDSNNDGFEDGQVVSLGYSPALNFGALITFIKTNPPSGLYSQAQYESQRTNGQNDILNAPNSYNLYTTNQIHAMAIGDLVLTSTNNGQFVLNYDIEQSEDLVNWTPYQGFAMPLTNLPTNKAFVRIKAKQ